MRSTFHQGYQSPPRSAERGGRINRVIENLKGKLVLVVGLGESGYAAALFLLYRGAAVRCTDSAVSASLEEKKHDLERFGAEVELGLHTESFCEGCELVVVSPGVDPRSLPLIWAEGRDIPVVSEVELAYRFCRSQVVAVTGTNGKTTTCELIHQILRQGGMTTATAGNIGFPFVRRVAEQPPPETLVVEVSSFQLERIHAFRPLISVVLNITEDHLDRYGSFRHYADAKRRIAENQGKGHFLIVNEQVRHLFPSGDGAGVPTILSFGRSPGADLCCRDGRVISRASGSERCYEVLSHWRLRGDHNLENVAAAIGVGELLGVSQEAIYGALSRFRGLDHRIQLVDEIHGVTFFDDSKGTNVDAVVKALESFARPVILIAGGRHKGGDYGALREAATEKVKLAVLIGEARERLMSSLSGVVPAVAADTLETAVEVAFARARRGDVVLLSPACSSFDMFTDYKQRGQAFQARVEQLKQETREGRKSHEAA